MPDTLMHLVQGLPTCGARAVAPFAIDGQVFLAVPQLAEDIAGAPASMNGGNSDIDLVVFQWTGGRFAERQRLAVSGGEDAEFFRIGDRAFLATASVRSGRGPYDLDLDSIVFEFRAGELVELQRFPTFAAKQWRHFRIGERDFLALAQGVKIDGVTAKNSPESTIFEWDGSAFRPFQTVASAWGYNWCHFRVAGDDFLAYADHVAKSVILRWTGTAFEDFQTLDGGSGRAFCFFASNGESYLAFANLLGETILYRWRDGRFHQHQILGGPGGREFTTFEHGGTRYVVQANILTGYPKAPVTSLQSIVYRLEGGQLIVAEEFPTSGATDVAAFTIGPDTFVAVAESLTAELRFRTDTRIYRFGAR
jgi:hypothetical protein